MVTLPSAVSFFSVYRRLPLASTVHMRCILKCGWKRAVGRWGVVEVDGDEDVAGGWVKLVMDDDLDFSVDESSHLKI